MLLFLGVEGAAKLFQGSFQSNSNKKKINTSEILYMTRKETNTVVWDS